MQKFKAKYEQRTAERTHRAQESLGPQKHSKPGSQMIPGQTEHFVIDEIKRRVDLSKKWLKMYLTHNQL